jgi:hypothetical protein
MKVKELIDLLKTIDGDTEVYHENIGEYESELSKEIHLTNFDKGCVLSFQQYEPIVYGEYLPLSKNDWIPKVFERKVSATLEQNSLLLKKFSKD